MLGKRGDWEPVFRDCCIIMAARETGKVNQSDTRGRRKL